MTKRILEIISLLSAILTAIMAYSDQLSPITSLSPYFAHLWPILGAVTLLLKIVASVLGDWLAKRAAQGGVPGVPPGVGSLIVLASCLYVTGCLSTSTGDPQADARNGKLNATGQYLVQKTIDVAFQSVLNLAQSEGDATAKENSLYGLASGMRTLEGSAIPSSDDVRNLVAIWTPAAPHYAMLGSQLAALYAKANPQTPAEARAAIENIAKGLDATAP